MPGIDSLVPDLRPWANALVDACVEAGLSPRVTSTLRSRAQQTKLYRRYLAGLSNYPVAPPGHSAHELGLAFDMVVSPMESLADVGALWESWGGGWGGRNKDPIHFEAPGASQQTLQEAQRSIYYDVGHAMVHVADEAGQFFVFPYALWRMLPASMQKYAPAGQILKYFDLL